MLTNKFRKWFIPIFLVGLVIFSGRSFLNQADLYQFRVVMPDGGEILADVADTPEEHLFGLFTAGSLPPNRGVLLMYEKADQHSLWGRNITSPVDIVWLDPEKKIVRIDEHVTPCVKDPCPSYQPDEEVLFLLQIGPGEAKRKNLEVGLTLKFRRATPDDT